MIGDPSMQSPRSILLTKPMSNRMTYNEGMNETLTFSIGRILTAVLVSAAALLLLRAGLRLALRRLDQPEADPDRLERLRTLVQAGRSIGVGLILLILLLMILHELGIDITPVLASAGVAGLALSLGAQTLIKDYLGGILILAEDQFSIGDWVSIGTVSGAVERITLRTTHLRDSQGQLNIVPNGDIRTVTNQTTGWAKTVLTFNLDFEADMDAVLRALEAAGQAIQADEAVKASLLEAPQSLGWSGFTDWSVQVLMIVKTKPGSQWAVGRALRRAALEQFRREGVRLAVPRQRMEMEG